MAVAFRCGACATAGGRVAPDARRGALRVGVSADDGATHVQWAPRAGKVRRRGARRRCELRQQAATRLREGSGARATRALPC